MLFGDDNPGCHASAKVVLGTAFSCVLLFSDDQSLLEIQRGMDEVCNDLIWLSVLLGAE